MPQNNSSNIKIVANAAPPGHPVPFTKPIGFLMSLIFGQPWVTNRAPSATRPIRAATSGYEAKTMGPPPGPHLSGAIEKPFTAYVDVSGGGGPSLERPLPAARAVGTADAL